MKLNFRFTAPLCLALLLLISPTAAADSAAEAVPEEPPLLSPGLNVLAARTTMRKCGKLGERMTFSQKDFANILGYTPTSVTVTTLPDPAVGVLKLGTLEIGAGSTLSAGLLDQLYFAPNSTEDAAPIRAEFTFTAAGGAYRTDTALSCMMNLLTGENGAPSGDGLATTTYAEVPLYATLQAADPEADALFWEVVRAPKKGVVSLDPESGSFVYTPTAGKRGKDVFTCRVTDEYGNESELLRVEVQIRRASEDLYYADLAGHPCTAAAMRLTEEGILQGTRLGGTALFSPDTAMTRGEFLIAAMRAAGYRDQKPQALPMFENAGEIPDYLSGYLSAAYEDGIVRGERTEGGALCFAYDTPITQAEAAVILYRLFTPETPSPLPVFSTETEAVLPAWSAGAYAAVSSAGLLPTEAPLSVVDRAAGARMLSSALDWMTRQ